MRRRGRRLGSSDFQAEKAGGIASGKHRAVGDGFGAIVVRNDRDGFECAGGRGPGVENGAGFYFPSEGFEELLAAEGKDGCRLRAAAGVVVG